jgi:hypothetical protein
MHMDKKDRPSQLPRDFPRVALVYFGFLGPANYLLGERKSLLYVIRTGLGFPMRS